MKRMKQTGIFALVMGFAFTIGAQEAQVITAQPAAELPEAANTVQVQSAPQTQAPPQVVIIQEPARQQAPASQPVVEQPTTVVEDSPLTKSRAEKLRENRQQAEVETEQKIVEKLEESRLKDEQKRMDRLFGDKLEAEAAEKRKEEQPVTTAPVYIHPQPVPVAQDPAEQINKDELKSEIAESVKADLQALKEEEKKVEPEKRFVIGAGIGTVDYEVSGIESDFAASVSIGQEFRERMELEGSFAVSQHTSFENVNFAIQEMDQYNLSVGVRYAVLPYFISPVVGALASYTHRVYSTPFSGFGNEMKTDSLDAGFLVGVDVLLSKNMAVAVDYKRFMNVENRVNNNALLNLQNYNGFENADYDMLNLALRFMF